jgi:polyhydroxyalkanoate synthesis regulator protein
MLEFNDMAHSQESVAIRQYANGRLHRPGAACDVTLGDLADMVEDEEDFVVYDAKSGRDITPSVLKQIILERANHDD